MALSHTRDVHGVIDELRVYEAALERATERRRAHSPQTRSAPWTPTRDSQQASRVDAATFADVGQATALDRERFSKSISSYSSQLQAWVNMQVDARLKLVLRDVENELNVSRQETRTATDMSMALQERLGQVEQLLVTIEGTAHRETAEMQQETLSAVGDLVHTVDELKRSFAAEQQKEVEDFRRLHSEHDAQLKEHVAAIKEMRKLQLEQFRAWSADHERKLSDWRDELVADLRVEISAVDTAWKQQASNHTTKRELEQLHRDVRETAECHESLRRELSRISDLEERQLMFEKAQRRMGDDLLAQQESLIRDIRAETSAAFHSKAEALNALDEQMWQTDKRLGQRIDQVSQQCNDLARAQSDIVQKHGDNMSRLKGLAESHRDFVRARSPDSLKTSGLTRSFPPEDLGGRLKTRSLAGYHRETDDEETSSTVKGGLGMARLAGNTLHELSQQGR